MASSSASGRELKELRQLYDEAVKNTTHLENEISEVKSSEDFQYDSRIHFIFIYTVRSS